MTPQKIWENLKTLLRDNISKASILALGAYTLLSVVFTYPVAFSADKIPGDGGDAYQFLWFFWWFKEALTNLGVNPFSTSQIFYPSGTNLIFSTVTPLNSLISIPLQSTFGLVAAYNIIWLASFVLSGFGAFLLVRYLTKDPKAAFIAGVIFMFSPYHFAHALGHVNLMSIQWIPLYVLFLIKTVREGGVKNAIYAGVFLLFTAMSCYIYLVYLVIFTLICLLYHSWVKPTEIFNRRTLQNLGITGATFGLLFSPILYLFIKEYLGRGSNYMYQGGFVMYSADLCGFFIPAQFNPFFENIVAPIYQYFTGNMAEYTVFLGYATMLLALLAIIKFRTSETKFWLYSALIYLTLALGPLLHINGVVTIPVEGYTTTILLPYTFLMNVPIFSMARAPSRWTVLIVLSLAVLAGYGLSYLFNKFEGKYIRNCPLNYIFGIVITVFILFEFLAVPYPMSSASIPTIYGEIASDPDDYAIFEIPANTGVAQYMYYQTTHGKALVNGYASRTPESSLAFRQSTPLIRELTLLKDDVCDDIINQNASEVGIAVLNHYNIRYIVIHRNYLKKEELQFILPLVNRTLNSTPKTYEKDNIIVYRVDESAQKTFMILSDGWNALEKWNDGPGRWMRKNASIFIYSPEDQDCTLSFEVGSFHIERDLSLYVNNELTGTYHISKKGYPDNTPDEIQLNIHLNKGDNVVQFAVSQPGTIPSEVGAWNDDRELSLAFQNIRII